MTIQLSDINFIILSVIAIFIGKHINHKIYFLEQTNIPKAVTGGLVFSMLFGLLNHYTDLNIGFDMEARDILLLVFFSSVGLNAKIKVLIAGGKSLVLLLIPAVILLFIQNAIGVGVVNLFGDQSVHGLFAGSIPLAGGHGTAVAWGAEASRYGFEHADAIGISFATFGLILGGLVGCPLATWLIMRYNLKPVDTSNTSYHNKPVHIPNPQLLPSVDEMLKTVLYIGMAINGGLWVNDELSLAGILVPDFVTVMLVAIIITNTLDAVNQSVNDESIDMANSLSLEVFLAMSLIAIRFSSFTYELTQSLVIIIAQVIAIAIFSVFVVFKWLGKDYDAAVIASGFVGLGLGATPVAIGNMSSITAQFGPSAKAFLIVPLVGAFFIDIANTIVLKLFLSFMENGF